MSMGAYLLAALAALPAVPPERLELAASLFLVPGMSRGTAEWVMGAPPTVDSFGPPKEYVVVYTYRRVCLTFDCDSRLTAIRR